MYMIPRVPLRLLFVEHFPVPLSRASRIMEQRHRGRLQTKTAWTRRREAEDELAALSGG